MYYGEENNLKVTVLNINKLLNFFQISSNYQKQNKIFTFNCILLGNYKKKWRVILFRYYLQKLNLQYINLLLRFLSKLDKTDSRMPIISPAEVCNEGKLHSPFLICKGKGIEIFFDITGGVSLNGGEVNIKMGRVH